MRVRRTLENTNYLSYINGTLWNQEAPESMLEEARGIVGNSSVILEENSPAEFTAYVFLLNEFQKKNNGAAEDNYLRWINCLNVLSYDQNTNPAYLEEYPSGGDIITFLNEMACDIETFAGCKIKRYSGKSSAQEIVAQSILPTNATAAEPLNTSSCNSLTTKPEFTHNNPSGSLYTMFDGQNISTIKDIKTYTELQEAVYTQLESVNPCFNNNVYADIRNPIVYGLLGQALEIVESGFNASHNFNDTATLPLCNSSNHNGTSITAIQNETCFILNDQVIFPDDDSSSETKNNSHKDYNFFKSEDFSTALYAALSSLALLGFIYMARKCAKSINGSTYDLTSDDIEMGNRGNSETPLRAQSNDITVETETNQDTNAQANTSGEEMSATRYISRGDNKEHSASL